MQEAIEGIIQDLDYSLGTKESRTGDFKSMKTLIPKQKKQAKVSSNKNILSRCSGKEEATDHDSSIDTNEVKRIYEVPIEMVLLMEKKDAFTQVELLSEPKSYIY